MYSLKLDDLKGKFVVVEGIDGMGKTTFVENLGKRLEELGVAVHVTRQPYGNHPNVEPFGQLSRFKEQTKLARWAVHLAAHSQQYEYEILPALKEGKLVLMDRCWWSAMAYNFMGDGLQYQVSREMGLFLEMMASQHKMPDLMVFIDGVSHRPEFSDRAGFNERVSQEYYKLVSEWHLKKAIILNRSVDGKVFWDDEIFAILHDDDEEVEMATEEQMADVGVEVIAMNFCEQPDSNENGAEYVLVDEDED